MRTVHRRQRNLPSHQVPCPDTHHQRHVEEVEDESAAKDNRVVAPSIFRSYPNSGHRNSPRQHPEEVRAKRLDEEPSSRGGKQDCCNLIIDCIEYVTPVNRLGFVSSS
jgi:hypothetical protein